MGHLNGTRTAKQHAVVSIQLTMVMCCTYSEIFVRCSSRSVIHRSN